MKLLAARLPLTVVLALHLLIGLAWVSVNSVAGRQAAPAHQPKEPMASEEEFQARVIHYPDLPPIELVKGSNARLVAGAESMISFLKMDAHSYFAPHRHKEEQIMIVLDGYCDEIIEGKRYRVKQGDVIVLPPNIEHGAYIYEQDVTVIDVFGGVRADYLMKMQQAMAKMGK